MAGFDENIVREYFEVHGFLVRQLRKYQVSARKKLAEEEIDLMVYNPTWVHSGRAPNFLLFSNELPYVHRAVVVVKGWHTMQRFTPTMLRSSSEIFKFLEANVLKTVADHFADAAAELTPGAAPEAPAETNAPAAQPQAPAAHADLLKILVLPGLPTSEPHRTECIHLLRERGVDAIISFRSMLLDLLQKVEVNRNYQKSEVLQILRILKNYDLVKDPQMDLFRN